MPSALVLPLFIDISLAFSNLSSINRLPCFSFQTNQKKNMTHKPYTQCYLSSFWSFNILLPLLICFCHGQDIDIYHDVVLGGINSDLFWITRCNPSISVSVSSDSIFHSQSIFQYWQCDIRGGRDRLDSASKVRSLQTGWWSWGARNNQLARYILMYVTFSYFILWNHSQIPLQPDTILHNIA